MEARERQDFQSRRPSIKRPWEEDTETSERLNLWKGTRLPPIDTSPYRRPSLLPRPTESENNWVNHHDSESGVRGVKRARYEEHDHSTSQESLDMESNTLRAQSSRSTYTPTQGSHAFASVRLQQDEGWGAETALEGSSLNSSCLDRSSCTGLRNQDLDDDSTELLKKNLKAALGSLNNVEQALDYTGDRALKPTIDCPPIEAGLIGTLNWLFDRIRHLNDLADKFMQRLPPRTSQGIGRNLTAAESNVQDDLLEIMRRQIDENSRNLYKSRDDCEETSTDAELHTRRSSATTALPGTEEFLSMRASYDYIRPHPSSNMDPNQRISMNPPPAPKRQLPSPPGRSLPSPTSLNFPSPSASSYGSSSQPGHLHHPSLSPYLPPIGPGHSPDALQAHTAALQHEVSVQKIALSSLQGEHNKLLAAFSRSQTRASALEKKHAVSDTEIISLTEEKLRLQSQVAELERDVEELARSRDEFRQAAVQEGAQYVEIVKRATRLEEVAGEERKGWNKLRAELEQKIDTLSGGSDRMAVTVTAHESLQITDDVDTPASSTDDQGELKVEPPGEFRSTSHPTSNRQESTEELKKEIRHLRNRCAEVENALHTVREESHNMEGIVEALGLAGKSILERVDRTLGGSC